MRHPGQKAVEHLTAEGKLRPGEQLLPIVPRQAHLSAPRQKKPEWLSVRIEHGLEYIKLQSIMREMDLHTVCDEARCPNIYECWNQGTATFMILGDTCTRACRFCGIKWGRPTHLDREEPRRVAKAIQALDLRHAVITSVNRDELADGGASIWAETIREVHAALPECSVEVLIPDFQGNWEALALVIAAEPEILNHIIETVPRLFRQIQPWDNYQLSLELLRRAKAQDSEILTKSGVIVGLGERFEEIVEVMRALVAVKLDIMTIGQYLPPSQRHAPLDRYYTPDEFAELKRIGESLGIRHVEAGPLVRSSYHAGDQYVQLRRRSRAPVGPAEA